MDLMKGGDLPGKPHPTAVWLLLEGLQGLCQRNKDFLPGMVLLCHLVQGCGLTPTGRFSYFERKGHIPQPVNEKFQPFQLSMSGKAAQENVSETAHHKEPEKDRRLKAL